MLAPEIIADIVEHGWRDCGQCSSTMSDQHLFDDERRCLHLVVSKTEKDFNAWVYASYYKFGGFPRYYSMPKLHKNADACAGTASELADELQFLTRHGVELRTAQLRYRFRRSTASTFVPLIRKRNCLCCSKPFASAGAHNRVCQTCIDAAGKDASWGAAA